jgi:hypothetical protein
MVPYDINVIDERVDWTNGHFSNVSLEIKVVEKF